MSFVSDVVASIERKVGSAFGYDKIVEGSAEALIGVGIALAIFIGFVIYVVLNEKGKPSPSADRWRWESEQREIARQKQDATDNAATLARWEREEATGSYKAPVG